MVGWVGPVGQIASVDSGGDFGDVQALERLFDSRQRTSFDWSDMLDVQQRYRIWNENVHTIDLTNVSCVIACSRG